MNRPEPISPFMLDPEHVPEAPQQWFVCDACEGSGVEVFGTWVYEPGCGFGHESSDERPCDKCKGNGGWIDDAPELNQKEWYEQVYLPNVRKALRGEHVDRALLCGDAEEQDDEIADSLRGHWGD